MRTHYLRQHGNKFELRLHVPRIARAPLVAVGALRPGADRLVHRINTTDLRVAGRVADIELPRLRALVREASRPQSAQNTVVLQKLAQMRATYRETENPFEVELQALEFAEGSQPLVDALYSATVSDDVLISEHVEQWIREHDYAPRSADAHRQAIRDIERMMIESATAPVLKNLTPKVASDFKNMLTGRGLNWQTVVKQIGAARQFARWLKSNNHLSTNPFDGLTVIKPRRHIPREMKFTDDEIKILIERAPVDLRRLILFLIYTAARRDEVMQLTVAVVADGLINIRAGKTSNAPRILPQCGPVPEIVAELSRGKKPSAYLFDERAENRGAAVGQRFGRFKSKVLPDTSGNMHSLRKWSAKAMASALENGATGFTPWTIAAVLGHSLGRTPLPVTFSIYVGDASMESKRAALSSIVV